MNDTNLPTVEQLLEAADRKVEELSRAIECLPKPQEGMGGSASERVANVIFLLQKARDERKPMECGHPRACLVEREVTNIEKNEGPLNDTEHCSACAEREGVREMCAKHVEAAGCHCPHSSIWSSEKWDRRHSTTCQVTLAFEIRQLDLTKDLAPSKETRRAEMFCNQCQGYVRVLAAPDHLKVHPEHTMQLRWYPPVDEGGEEK